MLAELGAVEQRPEERQRVINLGLTGIYSDPAHVIAWDDGEIRQEFSLCFAARPISGSLRPGAESRQARWVRPGEVGALDIHASMRLRIEHGLAEQDAPYIG